MTWEGPGFVDHHTHVLRVAAGVEPPWCDPGDAAAVADYHRSVAGRWSTPMDEPDPPLTVDDHLRGQLERGLARAASHGLVQVTEAGMTDWAYLEALLALRQRGPLPVRLRLFVASGIADVGRMARTGDPWLEVVGVKFYADGWVGPRTCALCRPFDDEDDAGVLFLDADTLASRADPFAEAGWTLATHAIGDRAIEACLDAYEKVYGSDCPEAAPRIEHAQVLNPELVERMATLGVVACIQPGFAVSDAETARAALGDRWEDAYRWDTLLDAGVRVIAGSDFPIETLSPLKGLQVLATGDHLDGRRAGAPTLPVERALPLMTDASAGTTVLSDDPHTVAEDEIAQIEVVEARPTG
ncbi:MAG TPA: amidohydrolase family protein [Acidimicrobiales bacterium]|nr:amidohydrolase family protein [Acidimicrobiales bacterium]